MNGSNIVSTGPTEALVDEHEIARLLGCSVITVRVDRRTRRLGLPFVKIGGMVRYRASAVLKHIESKNEPVAA